MGHLPTSSPANSSEQIPITYRVNVWCPTLAGILNMICGHRVYKENANARSKAAGFEQAFSRKAFRFSEEIRCGSLSSSHKLRSHSIKWHQKETLDSIKWVKEIQATILEEERLHSFYKPTNTGYLNSRSMRRSTLRGALNVTTSLTSHPSWRHHGVVL